MIDNNIYHSSTKPQTSKSRNDRQCTMLHSKGISSEFSMTVVLDYDSGKATQNLGYVTSVL